jgi:hypothetical protein
MTGATNDGGGNAVVERARTILLKPQTEWPRIEAEPSSVRDILVGYVLPLAAIGPVAAFIGRQIFGYGGLGFTYRPSLLSSLGTALVSYLTALVGVFVLSLIANFLAPKFGGRTNRLSAFKLVAYGSTAAFLAAVFGLVPWLGFLVLLGLYSAYLFYTGATPLMKVPQDKAIAYTAVTVVGAIVILILAGALGRAVVGAFVPGPTYTSDSERIAGTVNVPGVGTIDLDKAQQAAEEMEAAASGQRTAIDPARLQAFLPETIAGYARTSVETAALGGMGSEANGIYSAGGRSFRLKITDMAGVGALAGLGSAMGIARSREDADGFERTGTVNGRMQVERWNRITGSGTFSVVMDNRFLVEAEGSAASIDELKSAVAVVNEEALASLAD